MTTALVPSLNKRHMKYVFHKKFRRYTGKLGPGTLRWDPGPRTLEWDPKPLGGTLSWEPKVGPGEEP